MTGSEPTQGGFPLLDGYRALAAFMVLTTHVAFNTGAIFLPVVGPLMGRMDFGVTLFFLLSGFLLYRPWAKAAMTATTGPALGTYAVRRAARILPAYWVMVIFTLLVLPEIQPVRWQAWAVHLGLLHIYLPGFSLEGLTQTWSLATEVAFYVALPLIAWVTGRRFRGDPDRSARWQLAVLLSHGPPQHAHRTAHPWHTLSPLPSAGYRPDPSGTVTPHRSHPYSDPFMLGPFPVLPTIRRPGRSRPNPPTVGHGPHCAVGDCVDSAARPPP